MSPKIPTIAWRDFKLTVLRPAFLIGMIAIPVIGIAVLVGGVVLAINAKQPPLVGTVAIMAADDVVAAVQSEFDQEKLKQEQDEEIENAAKSAPEMMKPGAGMGQTTQTLDALTRGRVDIRIESHAGDMDELRQRLTDGDLLAAAEIQDGVLTLPEPGAAWPKPSLIVSEGLDSDHIRLIERQIGDAVVRVRAVRAGLDPDEMTKLMRRPGSVTKRLFADGHEASEGEGVRELKEMLPVAFFMLIWMATFISGQHLMMSTIEEKSNRVMEVLLSAVSPVQLMTGKIIGQGGVGLVIMSIYASLGIVALVAFTLMHIVPVYAIVLLIVYFFMAYFMIASIMAAVGSAVSDIREANTLITPVMMVLMLLWFLWFPISRDPNGTIATVFSFVPPAIPFAMALRLAAEEPVPIWQIAATLVWGSICVVGMVWMAAKIFRVGVLMYGKPPSLLELVKWLRYT